MPVWFTLRYLETFKCLALQWQTFWMNNYVFFKNFLLWCHINHFWKVSLLYVGRIYIAFLNITYGYPESCFQKINIFLTLSWNFSQEEDYRHFNLTCQQQPTQTASPFFLEYSLPLTLPLLGFLPNLWMLLFRFLCQILQISWASCAVVTVNTSSVPHLHSSASLTLHSFPWWSYASSWLQVLSLCWWLLNLFLWPFVPAELQPSAQFPTWHFTWLSQRCVKFDMPKTEMMIFLPKPAAFLLCFFSKWSHHPPEAKESSLISPSVPSLYIQSSQIHLISIFWIILSCSSPMSPPQSRPTSLLT